MIFNYRTLMLLILLPLVSYANDNTAQLKKLMLQNEHNQEWLKKYAKALATLDNLSSAEISYYVNYVVTDKQFQFKSEEGFNIIMAAIYAYHSSGEDGAALILMNTFIKHLGSEAYTEKYAELWFQMASIYELKGNIDSLNYVVEKTKEFTKKNTNTYYGWLMIQQRLLAKKEKYAAAIQATIEAAKYFEKTNNQHKLSDAYNALGYSYGAMYNYKDALNYYIQASKINIVLGNKKELARNYNNMGAMYNALKNYDKASESYEFAYQIILQFGDIQLLAQNLTNRGNIYEHKGDFRKSIQLFQECYDLCKKHTIQFGVMLSELNLGNSYRLMKDYSIAETFLKNSLEKAIKMKVVNMESFAYKYLADLYVAKNDWHQAYEMKEKFHAIDDSIHNETISKQTLELKEKYESEKKQHIISNLSEQKLVQELIIFLLLSVILLSIVIVLFYRNKQKQAKIDAIQLLNEQNILKRSVEIKEKELTRQITLFMNLEEDIQSIQDQLLLVVDDTILGSDDMKKKVRYIIKSKSFSQLNESFNQRITEVNENFFKMLLKLYIDLTPNELKICAYLRLNLSTKEISHLFSKSIRTIESTRTDIRKKMKLSAETNLTNHLIGLGL